MANDRSFVNSELQKSSSFLDYCIPANSSDPNNINHIKLDNFNLRLRCYNMSELLSKCTCSQDMNDKDRAHQENTNKLNSFIDNQKELQAENSLLQEENKILKSQLNYFKNSEKKLAEFESIKYECDRLKNVLNNNLSGNEFLQDLIKQNEELIKSNIAAKLKIKHLKLNVTHLKRHSLVENSQFLMDFSGSRNLQTKLSQDFNDSLEISKNVSLGCIHCDVLKVNYEHIYDMFLKQVDKHEMTFKDLQRKELRIKDLEKELENLRAEPMVSEEKLKKCKRLLKGTFTSIAKKDKENLQMKNESKEMVDFYTVEMGKLNHKIESLLKMGKCNLLDQNNTIEHLSAMLLELFNHLSIKTKPETIDNSDSFSNKSLQFTDSNLDKLKRNWNIIVNSMNKLRECVVYNDQHLDIVECNISKEIHDKRNKSVEIDHPLDLSIEYIINKFEEVKELTVGLRDNSKCFNTSYQNSHASYRKEMNETDNFSPQ